MSKIKKFLRVSDCKVQSLEISLPAPCAFTVLFSLYSYFNFALSPTQSFSTVLPLKHSALFKNNNYYAANQYKTACNNPAPPQGLVPFAISKEYALTFPQASVTVISYLPAPFNVFPRIYLSIFPSFLTIIFAVSERSERLTSCRNSSAFPHR